MCEAVTAAHIKVPAEKSLLLQVAWPRDEWERRQVTGLCWADTRDMAADGLTKRVILRAAHRAIMEDEWRSEHETACWRLLSPLGGRDAHWGMRRSATEGEFAQMSRRPAASANEDGDGPGHDQSRSEDWRTAASSRQRGTPGSTREPLATNQGVRVESMRRADDIAYEARCIKAEIEVAR